MFSIKWLICLLQKTYRKTRKFVELTGYDHTTIYKYFRKQGAVIGEGCIINTKSLGAEPYLVKLGNHVWISNDVEFHTHDGGVWVLMPKHPNIWNFGPIVIEDNCIIGNRAQLMPNIRIGKNSIVGVGSVVLSDVPPNSIVMGVPARPFGGLVKYEEKCVSRWQIQQPSNLEILPNEWWKSKDGKMIRRNSLVDIFKDQLAITESLPSGDN